MLFIDLCVAQSYDDLFVDCHICKPANQQTEAVDCNYKQLKKKKRSQMERGRRQIEMVMSKAKSGPVLSVKQMAVIIYRGRERKKNKIKHQKISSFMSQSECVVNT